MQQETFHLGWFCVRTTEEQVAALDYFKLQRCEARAALWERNLSGVFFSSSSSLKHMLLMGFCALHSYLDVVWCSVVQCSALMPWSRVPLWPDNMLHCKSTVVIIYAKVYLFAFPCEIKNILISGMHVFSFLAQSETIAVMVLCVQVGVLLSPAERVLSGRDYSFYLSLSAKMLFPSSPFNVWWKFELKSVPQMCIYTHVPPLLFLQCFLWRSCFQRNISQLK